MSDNKQTAGESYICALCHGGFTETQSDEEAEAEALMEFGPRPGGEKTRVCDDCYQARVKPFLKSKMERN